MRIETELDRLLDEADHRAKRAEHRRRIGRGVFEAHKRRAAADPKAHPLRKVRLSFRGEGLSVAELAERAAVGESTILDIENGKGGSDLTWLRLTRALGVRRSQIDPSFIYSP